MCKKLAITTVFLVAVVAALSFTWVGSHLQTALNNLNTAAKKQVPIDFELQRLRDEVGNIKKDVDKNRELVANEMAQVERREREIAAERAGLEKRKVFCDELARKVKSGETQIFISSKPFTLQQAAERMNSEWNAYKRDKASLELREKELAYKKEAVESAKEQLKAMMDQEAGFRLELSRLESELQAVKVAETRSQFQLDDSRVGDIKTGIEDVRTRIAAKRYKVQLAGEVTNAPTTSVEKPKVQAPAEVADEILAETSGSSVTKDRQ